MDRDRAQEPKREDLGQSPNLNREISNRKVRRELRGPPIGGGDGRPAAAGSMGRERLKLPVPRTRRHLSPPFDLGLGRRHSGLATISILRSLRRRVGRVRKVAVVPSPLMPAAVYVGDGRIAVEQVPRPEPGPDEVLVEIAECGICGSDLHMVLERYAKPGAILGHEWSGVVAAAPAGSGWSVGDRVVGNPAPGCGACRPCRRGRPSVCLNRASGRLRRISRRLLPVQDSGDRRPDQNS